jgi:hypothetical protein
MWQSFVAKNFRSFSSVEIKDLARVNLIAGKNNTGKTALLEAIRLHCDSSDSLLPTTINEGRGIDDPAKAFGEYWAWLFLDKNPAYPVVLSSQDDTGKKQEVTIRLTDIASARSEAPGLPKPPENFPGQGWHAAAPCLVVKHEGPQSVRVVWVIGPHGEAWYTPAEAWRVPCGFVGASLPSADRDVANFSTLENEKRLGEILPSLCVLEPRLERLSLTLIGDRPVIHGDIGRSRLVPVSLMGEGVRRLLSILLAVFNTAGGVILIDEIENGLHYSIMKVVWTAIAKAARQADVQVFATTHSYECIQAAHEAFAESNGDDLRLLRLDRVNGEITVVVYDNEVLEYALEMTHEVR